MKINTVNINQTIQTHQHVQAKSNAVNLEKNAETNTTPTINDEYVPISSDKYEVQSTEDTTEEQRNELLDKSVEQANQSLKLYDRKLEMQVHEVTKTIMYTLRDTKTNEVIMEFPPKKIQDMIAKMWELAGLFVDKRA